MKAKSLLLSLLLLVSLGAYAQDAAQGAKKYGFKSAITKMNTDMMGQTIETTGYIDNYGALECQKVTMDVPGMGKFETAVISKEGKSWQVNYTMKQVEETPVQEQVNFLEISDADVEKYKIKEIGKETLLGKEGTGYSVENEVQGMKANLTVSVYKGIAFKTVTEVQGYKIVITMTEFQEDAMVLPQVFDIPKFK